MKKTSTRILKSTAKRMVETYGNRIQYVGWQPKLYKSWAVGQDFAKMWDHLIMRGVINAVMVLTGYSYLEAYDWCITVAKWCPDELNHKPGRVRDIDGDEQDNGPRKRPDLWCTINYSPLIACLLDHLQDLYEDIRDTKKWSRQKLITFMSMQKPKYTISKGNV